MQLTVSELVGFVYDPRLHAEYSLLARQLHAIGDAYETAAGRIRHIRVIEGLQYKRYRSRVMKWRKTGEPILSYTEWLVAMERLERTFAGTSLPHRQRLVAAIMKKTIALSPNGDTTWFDDGMHRAVLARVPLTDELTRADFTVQPGFTSTKKNNTTPTIRYTYEEVRL